MNLCRKQKQTHGHRVLCLPKGGAGGRMEWEAEISRGRLLYTECINRDPTVYSTGIYIKWASQVVLVVKNPPANAGDIYLLPASPHRCLCRSPLTPGH